MRAREAAIKTLVRIMDEQAFSNLEISHILDTNAVDERDRKFYVNLVYGTLQHLNTIDWILKQFIAKNFDKQKAFILWLLRLSVYEIFYLDNVPEHAIVNGAVEYAKKRAPQLARFVNGVLRNILREKDRLKIEIENLDDATRFSIPQWIIEKYRETYGDGATRLGVKSVHTEKTKLLRK